MLRHHWRFGGPGRPPVSLKTIRGEVMLSRDLTWPTLVWNDGRCWAFLHDLQPAVLARVMARLRESELERSDPNGSFAL
jgi:hypothetical protein